MSENKSHKSPAIYAILAWIAINAMFFILELTVLGDYVHLNSSTELILWVISFASLFLMKKWGAALVTFTLTYSFAFNTFNFIYFSTMRLLNGTSAIINAIAIVYMFKSIFENRFE